MHQRRARERLYRVERAERLGLVDAARCWPGAVAGLREEGARVAPRPAVSSGRFEERRSDRATPVLGRGTPPAPRGLRPATAPGQEVLMSADRPNRSARSTLLAERAHAMRQCPTWSEQVLWECALRRRGLGVEFRRQVVIADRFIVDFLAPAQKLIVEVDGPYHQSVQSRDARRERKLERLGYRILRLEAEQVVRDLPEAVARILVALRCAGSSM